MTACVLGVVFDKEDGVRFFLGVMCVGLGFGAINVFDDLHLDGK